MIGSTRAVRVFAWPAPADLRKGYDGLHGLVESGLGRDPLSGDLFLFVNRLRNRCKVLLWDGTGFCIYMKRLEQGRFTTLWHRKSEATIMMTQSELALFLEGSRFAGKVQLSPDKFVPVPLTNNRL